MSDDSESKGSFLRRSPSLIVSLAWLVTLVPMPGATIHAELLGPTSTPTFWYLSFFGLALICDHRRLGTGVRAAVSLLLLSVGWGLLNHNVISEKFYLACSLFYLLPLLWWLFLVPRAFRQAPEPF